jgi:diadenylate cyclase
MQNGLWQMQVKDFFDLLLVSAVLYVFLSWLRLSLPRGVARRSMVAAPIAAAVYVLAQVFDLYLLQRVLEGLLVAVLVGAVVVYQTDIRRLLDRAFTGRAADRPQSRLIDILTEATDHMAGIKMGALIAIRGREPWASHIHGGVELGGSVSAPLLYSIFNPDTPGHDGAILIEDERVTRFAAHLPLAEELPDVSRYGGTRHAAALGLSQQCDALIIVVSEERGTVSIAHDGKLTADITAATLRQQLRRFLHRRDRDDTDASVRSWGGARLRTGLASVALSMGLWMVLAYSPDTVLRTFTVPIALHNLPEDWVVADELPMDAQVELSGSRRNFDELDFASLTVSIDLSRPARGVRDVVIGDDTLALPAGITLRRARPAVLSVRLQPTRTVLVPVAVPTVGVLPDTLELVSLRAEPNEVSLVVPEDAADPEHVSTEVVDLRQIAGDTTIQTPLAVPPDSHLPSNVRSEVEVRVDVRSRQ